MRVFLFIVLFAVIFALVAAKPVPFKPCGQLPHAFKVLGVDLLPDTIRPGSELEITIKGIANQVINGGQNTVEVYFLGMRVNTLRLDLCEGSGGCPIRPNVTIDNKSKAPLPGFVPRGNYVIISKQRDNNGKDLGCITFDMKIQ